MQLKTYARRQLNPFSGVLQVVETSHARAFSVNGQTWQIQVLAEHPAHTWRSTLASSPAKQFFNWASWHPQQGLHNVCANPVLDLGAMSQACDELTQALTGQLQHLPFSLNDHYECWACDDQKLPIALVASACSLDEKSAISTCNWQASQQSDLNKPLEKHIQQATHKLLWFQRHANMSGTCLDESLTLDVTQFPELLLRAHWLDKNIQQMVHSYLNDLSPLLLSLPLPKNQRREMEIQASKQAQLMANLYLSYPEVIDHDLLERTRIAAKLQNARLKRQYSTSV